MKTIKFPFDNLPTDSLGPLPVDRRKKTYADSGDDDDEKPNKKPYRFLDSVNSSQFGHQLADEPCWPDETGLRIQKYIYANNGVIDPEEVRKLQKEYEFEEETRQASKYHKPSFNIESIEKRANENSGKSKSILGRMRFDLGVVSDYLRVASVRNNKLLTKACLFVNSLTIEILVTECQVDIVDMKKSGAFPEFKDLIDLDFKMTDLFLNPDLLSVSKLVIAYKVTYPMLKKEPSIRFSVVDLLECEFYPSDLELLKFKFGTFFEGNPKAITKEQLKKLKFSLGDLMTLGFTKEHQKMMSISDREALNAYHWDKELYKIFS